MIKVAFNFFVFTTLSLFTTQILAGAQTNITIVNGPDIPSQGVVIKGVWPGFFSIVPPGDLDDPIPVPAPTPSSDLPRYVVAGATQAGNVGAKDWRYTVLYVWDKHANRAVVYLPGPSELGYAINNGTYSYKYKKWAGRWYYAEKKLGEEIYQAITKNRDISK